MNQAIHTPSAPRAAHLPAAAALIGEDFDADLAAPAVDQPWPASRPAPSVAEALLKLPFALPRAA